ncbi:MAG: DUF2911 domain-containing protein [Flavisolibacter sp.]
MMDYIKNANCGRWIGVLALLFLFSCSDSTSRDTTQRRPDIQITDSPVRVQDNPFAPVDVSPMDIAYLPSDYPIMKMTGGAKPLPLARVIYSRPHRQGRAIFGGLIKYGEPWRLGANEATEIEFFQPVTIQNKKIPKGRYVLYCIPQEDKWTIVFNSNLYSWGLKPHEEQDLYNFDIPVTTRANVLEYFTMVFEQPSENYELVMAWENKEGRLPLQF